MFLRHAMSFVLAVLACVPMARAQGAAPWPSRPITMINPAPAGGATDVLARTLADQLAKALGQPVVVDNRPGASGMLAAQAAARAPGDGYTLLFTTSTPIYYAPYTFGKPLPYDVRKDLAFITQVCDATLVLAVNSSVSARNMKEFVDWAAARRGQVSYGSYGVGSAGHLVSSYLSESRNLGMNHVPYKGETPMLQDLIGGQIPWTIATMGSMAPHFKSGRLRPIAVLGDARLPELPDVPTLAEEGFNEPEFKLIGGLVLMVPASTPAAIRARLEQEARAAIRGTQMQARFQAFGLPGVGNSAQEAQRAFEASGPVIEKLVRISGAKMD